MRFVISLACLLAALPVVLPAAGTEKKPATAPAYMPKAQFCADTSAQLCVTLPAYIGPDPALSIGVGYHGLGQPTSPKTDSQTPFDNMSWQSFVALNWQAESTSLPPSKGLTTPGPRVWQKWPKVSDVFGDGPVLASCSNPDNLPVIAIATNGAGAPSAHNDEYFQASTNLPLIDINGNWTLYERRLNAVEVQYLDAPGGNPGNTLRTAAGQTNFIAAGGKVVFTPSATTQTGKNGAMELKASWRIMGPNDNPAKFYTQQVLLTVPADLVTGDTPICASVTVGLVGMHIIQKNPFYAANKNLRAQWIWSTFEHVDNAPLAAAPCDPSRPAACATLNQPSCGAAQGVSSNFSYYDAAGPAATNVQPTPSAKGPEFAWSPTQPYGSAYATQTGSGGTAAYAGPQATRCWQIFRTTAALNAQWQTALNQVGSVFANYMLISTQWGANIEPTGPSPVPNNAVPQMLSNVTLETYIQNNATPQGSSGPGSCVSCHNFATLVDNKTPSDFSFLPGLAAPDTVRKAKLRDKF